MDRTISPMSAKWVVGGNEIYVEPSPVIAGYPSVYAKTTAIGLWALLKNEHEDFRVRHIYWARIDGLLYLACCSRAVLSHRIINQQELHKFLEFCTIRIKEELDWRVCGF